MERILIFILLFFTPKLLASQVFNWETCINLVVQKNAELNSKIETFKSFEALEGKSYFNYYPQLSADILNDRGENVGVIRTINAESTSARSYTNNYTAVLTGRWNLFNGLKDLGNIRQADFNTKATGETIKITKSKLSYDLKVAFEGLKIAKEYQKLTQLFIKRREENLNIVELRYHGGMENKGSVLLSRGNLDQAKYDDLVAKNIEKVSRAQLARVLGYDEFSDIDIRGDVPITDPPNNPQFKDIAKSSPYYLEASFKEASADAGITISKSEFFPRFEIYGTLGQQGTSLWPNDVNRWTAGVVLTFPFFNGGRDYYGTKSAVNTWASSVSNRIDVSRNIVQNLEKAHTQFVEAVLKNKVDFTYMEAAKLRAEIARKKYNNGLLIFDDWVIIENEYVNNSKNYLLSKRDRVVAEANWEYAQGVGVIP